MAKPVGAAVKEQAAIQAERRHGAVYGRRLAGRGVFQVIVCISQSGLGFYKSPGTVPVIGNGRCEIKSSAFNFRVMIEIGIISDQVAAKVCFA